MCDKKIKIKSV
jgi:hypothetical protein